MQQLVRKVASRTATVVGTAVIVTVVVAGGLSVAQAATEAVANNSVNSAKIVNNSVQGIDIKNESVQGVDIQDESITNQEILNGTIQSADINDDGILSVDIADGAITAADLSSQIRPVAAVVTIGVAGAPTMNRERGVASVSHFGEGLYIFALDNGVNISDCYLLASMNGFDTGNSGWSITTDNGGTGVAIRTFPGPGSALDPVPGDGFTFFADC